MNKPKPVSLGPKINNLLKPQNNVQNQFKNRNSAIQNIISTVNNANNTINANINNSKYNNNPSINNFMGKSSLPQNSHSHP